LEATTPMTAGAHIHAVLPVKPFARAKTRLERALAASERVTLARLMFEDVLDALMACRDIFACTVVVTTDPQAAALARRLGAGVLADSADCGINAAISSAVRNLSVDADDALLVVPSDIPQVTRVALAQAAAAVAAERTVVIAGAARDGGTNLLACRPVHAIPPLFGPDSFERHRSTALRAGFSVQILTLAELSLDVDRPDDLCHFLKLNSNTRSHAFLSNISLKRRIDRLRGKNAQPLKRQGAEV
jgi:2-phospho-L-lactate/phosphoenolpyruvate guanylyltransferase